MEVLPEGNYLIKKYTLPKTNSFAPKNGGFQ